MGGRRRASAARKRPSWRAFVARAVLAACGFAAVAQAADAPFRGDADVRLGARVHAAFPDSPPGPHRWTFFATGGTAVFASVRRDAGSTLVPTLRLTHPGGVLVAAGKGASPRILGARVPYAGRYVLEVGAKRGSGGYTLATTGKIGRGFVGLFPRAPEGAESYAFDAAEGTSVSVRVAPRRRGPSIEITGLESPTGDVLPVLSVQRGAAAELRDVPITRDGRWRVRWTNHGKAGDLVVTFRFRPPSGAAPVAEFGVSDGLASTVIEKGDPSGAAREGFVGSGACGRCHEDLVRSWSDTAHNSAVRSWNRPGLSGATMANDSDGDGTDDFREGFDLATTSAFAAYGVNAPKLSFVAGAAVPNRVAIGAATYTVDRTMGGNGLWIQRYLTKVGAHYQVLPFQFDEKSRTYAAYRAEDWYDAANSPRAAVSKDRSFEAQCSGCHETGETIASDGAGGFRTGYVELNIGCEQCHGPGAAHAATGDTRKILNPRRLQRTPTATPGESVAKANDVCARCHTKGTSVDPLPGGVVSEFGFHDGNVAKAGDAVADFLRPSTDAADFWGRKSNPLPTVPGDTSVAARTDRNHGQDVAGGEHGPHSDQAAACFDCHDPHARTNAHQVATSVTNPDRGVRVATRADDNSLCLSCHAQRPDDVFEALGRADVALIRGGAAPASVAAAVIDHMRDIGMPVRVGMYDPVGTGVGRCTTCHMPKSPTLGATTTDKGGFVEGDMHGHRFEIVWPRASALYGTTNSCNVCHPTSPTDKVGPILTQWANPIPGRTAFHGATPTASQDGIALNRASNPSHAGGGERRCIACHTSEGFVELIVNGDRDAMPQSEVDKLAKEFVAQDRGVSCDACHGRDKDGLFQGRDANPLRVPKEELCGRCHNAETVTFDDFRTAGAVVRHPQQEMIDGTAGATPPGVPATATTSHSLLPDSCVTCHYDSTPGVATHDFAPKVSTCASCHAGLATFDRTAKADYDGDGVVRGIQTEVQGLLDRLKAALLLDARMTFAAERFDFAGATNHALTGATDAQKRAVFNWYSVADDKSRGVHNAARAVQLLQASYRELTGADVPGATIR